MAVMYEFTNGEGRIIQRFYPIGLCPREIEENGEIYRRHYTPNYFAMHTDETPMQDAQKRHDELQYESREIGIERMQGLKNQTDAQKLKDIRENKSQFRDQMQKANEENREKFHKKNVEESRKRQAAITDEKIKHHIEQKQKREYDQRKLTL